MDLAKSTVAVTGASGFIGRYLVRELCARGARVVAVVRNPAKVPALQENAEVRRADLADVSALTDAFAGTDAVMANAGVVSIGRTSKAALVRANVDGTRNVLTAMARAGVRRAVLTSSASVYKRKRGRYRESDALLDVADFATPLTYYSVTKAVAEREAWRASRELGIALSVARPSGVYGAWDATGFTSWFLRFMRPRLVTVFPSRLYVPNVYAGDLAAAMCAMLEREHAIGRAYNVTGDPDVSFWDMLDAYREAGGAVPRVVLPVPIPLRFAYDTSLAEQDLGFANRPAVAGFTETIALQELSSG
jgi:dihydroflavonol-4-reductase